VNSSSHADTAAVSRKGYITGYPNNREATVSQMPRLGETCQHTRRCAKDYIEAEVEV